MRIAIGVYGLKLFNYTLLKYIHIAASIIDVTPNTGHIRFNSLNS